MVISMREQNESIVFTIKKKTVCVCVPKSSDVVKTFNPHGASFEPVQFHA